jgi:hypothetical protein
MVTRESRLTWTLVSVQVRRFRCHRWFEPMLSARSNLSGVQYPGNQVAVMSSRDYCEFPICRIGMRGYRNQGA